MTTEYYYNKWIPPEEYWGRGFPPTWPCMTDFPLESGWNLLTGGTNQKKSLEKFSMRYRSFCEGWSLHGWFAHCLWPFSPWWGVTGESLDLCHEKCMWRLRMQFAHGNCKREGIIGKAPIWAPKAHSSSYGASVDFYLLALSHLPLSGDAERLGRSCTALWISAIDISAIWILRKEDE